MIQPTAGGIEGLFTKDGEKAPDSWADDLANLRCFIDRFYKKYALSSGITNFLQLLPVEFNADALLGANVRMKTPSVFKISAAFTIGFMQECPLEKNPIGPQFLGSKLGHIDKHQDAIVAFEYIRWCLEGATFHLSTGEEVKLKNKIRVSEHYYTDLIHAISTLPKKTQATAPSFHELALIYEALAYQQNTDCCDPSVV